MQVIDFDILDEHRLKIYAQTKRGNTAYILETVNGASRLYSFKTGRPLGQSMFKTVYNALERQGSILV